jgi:hypothetical protein
VLRNKQEGGRPDKYSLDLIGMRFGRPEVKKLLRKQQGRKTKRRVGTRTCGTNDHSCDRGWEKEEKEMGNDWESVSGTGIEKGSSTNAIASASTGRALPGF